MKKYIVSLVLVSSVLSACGPSQNSLVQPVPQPMAYQEPPAAYSNPGSLFSSSNARYLYEDSRARKVGDIVMVNIMEASSGSSTASTETDRESTQNMGITGFFGMEKIPILGIPLDGGVPILETSSTREFSGSGSTSRENVVSATIASRVLNVMPDGLMHIEGVREIKVNNEIQYMMVAGLIRAQDISPTNTISSNQMANAKIEFYGEGIISDRQKPGWLTRFLDVISPF